MEEKWQAPEFPITYCPPGEAYGSHLLRTDGNPFQFEDLTVRPKPSMGGFTSGGRMPNWNVKGRFGLVWFWHQEYVVYMKEMTPYIRAQLLLEAIEEQAKRDSVKFGDAVPTLIAMANQEREAQRKRREAWTEEEREAHKMKEKAYRDKLNEKKKALEALRLSELSLDELLEIEKELDPKTTPKTEALRSIELSSEEIAQVEKEIADEEVDESYLRLIE